MSVVLITGANKGIGLELTRIYANDGNTVLACCRNPHAADDLNALSSEQDVKLLGVQITDDASVKAMVEEVGDQPVDLLINNAGMAGPAYDKQTVFNMDFDAWAETLNVNAMAPVRVMNALMPNLKAADGAKVVSITSQMGAISVDMTVAYAY